MANGDKNRKDRRRDLMKSIPVVLIIVISSITYNISSYCKPSRRHPFMLEHRKEVSAETCYIIDFQICQQQSRRLSLCRRLWPCLLFYPDVIDRLPLIL
ncbi:hypothetical protein DM01DRAFT_1332978 [Hesseltinella vesiculosa]|uniref:Uncharacterized protein n=1 Tax=Hesseltinella vesiculosa TaxID=101127 RepID=A0A1X2GQZ5_9FUNG|nr:hypothetical protein DM01DRAFT_1332972 [Hesseltinella vesiculosa]ORX59504.1 hypothetical protein DM01DRAFT_1332978 [Hesseltinella vesiculosa]